MRQVRVNEVPRLCTAIQQARLALRKIRETRRDMVRLYTGRHYSEDASPQSQPVNLISLYLSIVGRSLVAKNPRVMYSTFDPTAKPAVKAMEKWANKELGRIRFDKTLQRAVIDALFSVGIIKVALADP